ncbi:hypothetical protein ABT133_07915 [Streptomyces sp. NPDC001835]|uniref:hypothetical protein n=1 Tax=unclassified Streptomyces TaxID=2593676 RepID=UPI00332CF92B
MERLNDFLRRHLWVQMLLSVLLASTLILLLYPSRSAASVVTRTALCSVGGIAVVVAARRREKRAAGGSTDRLVGLDGRLREGEAPTDPAERDAMRALVEQRLHRTRHRVAAQVVLVVLFCSVTALTALTAGARPTLGFALLTVVFLGWFIPYGNLQHRRLCRMRAALADDRHGPGATGAEPHDR